VPVSRIQVVQEDYQTLKMEAARCTEKSVTVHQSTLRRILEGLKGHTRTYRDIVAG
jgi:hypothetical protein